MTPLYVHGHLKWPPCMSMVTWNDPPLCPWSPKMTPLHVHGHWASVESELVMWLPNLPSSKKSGQTNRHTDPLLYISKIYIYIKLFYVVEPRAMVFLFLFPQKEKLISRCGRFLTKSFVRFVDRDKLQEKLPGRFLCQVYNRRLQPGQCQDILQGYLR